MALLTIAAVACAAACTSACGGPVRATSPGSRPAPTVEAAATTVATADPGAGTAGAGPTAPDGDPPGFTLLAAGDILAHLPVAARAHADAHGAGYDFGPMLADVAPVVTAADLAICHVETPLSPDDRHLSGFPRFNSPHEIAPALAGAGFDGCSTASNHSVDQGLAGVTATLDALDAAHLGHAGTARSAAERDRIDTYTVHGVQVAHLSYTYGTNGLPVPARAPWSVSLTSVPTILADAHRARQQGAAFVVVSMHWGNEYQVTPTTEQQAQAAELLASPDVDLLLGDHVHVQQPVARIGGKIVVYGLGNLLSNQSPAAGLRAQTQDGSLITVHVHGVRGPQGVTYRADEVTYTATFCSIGSYVVVPVTAALADARTPAALRPALRASLARTAAIQSAGVAVPAP